MDVENKEAAIAPEQKTAQPVAESAADHDVEYQQSDSPVPPLHQSAFKSLGFLDQFLAVWILLAMVIGILLGNFVPSTGPALQKGSFVGVSIPIGMALCMIVIS